MCAGRSKRRWNAWCSERRSATHPGCPRRATSEQGAELRLTRQSAWEAFRPTTSGSGQYSEGFLGGTPGKNKYCTRTPHSVRTTLFYLGKFHSDWKPVPTPDYIIQKRTPGSHCMSILWPRLYPGFRVCIAPPSCTYTYTALICGVVCVQPVLVLQGLSTVRRIRWALCCTFVLSYLLFRIISQLSMFGTASHSVHVLLYIMIHCTFAYTGTN